MDYDVDELRDRIRDAVPAKVARIAGIRPSTLYSFLDGKTNSMRGDTRDKVVKALDTLAQTTRASDLTKPGAKKQAPTSTEIVTVPVYDIRASAGAGALVNGEEVETFQPFRQSQIDRLSRSRIDDLSVITVSGDSMWETLHDGDNVLVDRSVRRVVREGIYILMFEEELLVKRCQRNLETGGIQIISDNKAYPMQEVADVERFEVLGRVIWIGRALG